MGAQERVIERTARFVQIPSYSSQEAALQVHIASDLKQAGVPFFIQDRNVVARVEGKSNRSVFIIITHPDVVGEEDPSKWPNGKPFSGHIEDGNLHGRGSCDMKAGLSAGMEVLIDAQNSPTPPPSDLVFVSAVCEETDGSGAKSFTRWFVDEGLAQKYERIAMVFPEPTGLVKVMYGHRGNIPAFARVKSDGGHASSPDSVFPHPPENLAEIVVALKKLRGQWQKVDHYAEFGGMSVTTTGYEESSGSHNQISSDVAARIDIRTVPGYHALAKVAVENIIRDVNGEIELLPDTPPARCDPNSELIQIMRELIPDVCVEQFKAASDMGHALENLPQERREIVQGIIFGPGYLEDAHTTHEVVPVDHIVKAADLLKKLYFAWGK